MQKNRKIEFEETLRKLLNNLNRKFYSPLREKNEMSLLINNLNGEGRLLPNYLEIFR